jgi:hypothetical protein
MNPENLSQPLVEKALEFTTLQAAEEAKEILELETIDPQNLSIESRESSANDIPLSRRETRKSAAGGALSGGVFGVLVGLILSWAPTHFSTAGPDVSGNPGMFVFGVCTLCGIAGAFGFGLVGALTRVPSNPLGSKEENEQENSVSYFLVVRGDEATIDRALSRIAEISS